MLRYVCHTHAVAINTKIGCTFNIQKLFKISRVAFENNSIKLLISIYINVHVSWKHWYISFSKLFLDDRAKS